LQCDSYDVCGEFLALEISPAPGSLLVLRRLIGSFGKHQRRNLKNRLLRQIPISLPPLRATAKRRIARDQPDPMLEAWKFLAKKEGITLIAPALPRIAAFGFRCMVEDAKKIVPLDPRRIYIFGHSMGGYLGYDAAMLQSNYFAAGAVHAMGISEDYYWIVARTERKTPVAIYIGDREQPVLCDKARKTRDLLRKENFPVHYVELTDHDQQPLRAQRPYQRRRLEFPRRQKAAKSLSLEDSHGTEPVSQWSFRAGSITGG
jgi:hypothetical protein